MKLTEKSIDKEMKFCYNNNCQEDKEQVLKTRKGYNLWL